jgi:hypothetical protein
MAVQSVQEFFECYLRDKAEAARLTEQLHNPLHEKYLAEDLLNYFRDFQRLRNENPETLVSTEIYDESAITITNVTIAKRQHRHRYLLRAINGNWKIHSIEWECFACKGSGQRGDKACQICKGAGWTEPRKTAT